MNGENKNLSQVPPQELLTLAQIDTSWDVIIVGDGSGSRWGYPGGWAAIVFDKDTGLRKTLFGAMSDTTVNICELSPYIYAMQWYIRGPGKDLQKRILVEIGTHRQINVHIVTDCQVIARQGNNEMDREVNAALWMALDYFPRLNYKLHFHWVPRSLLEANRDCDALSKDMRYLITSIEQRLDDQDLK